MRFISNLLFAVLCAALYQTTASAEAVSVSTEPVAYRVFQSTGPGPRILKVYISSPSAITADKLYFSLILQSADPIRSAQVKLQLDHGVKTVPLKNQSTDRETIYSGMWKVNDTWKKKYVMTFEVRDSKKQTNSISIAWDKPCQLPASGDWRVTSSCVHMNEDALESGSILLEKGATLTLNALLGRAPKQSVSLLGGSILMSDSAKIVKGYLWQTDQDGDLYAPANATSVIKEDRPVGFSRRKDIRGVDCDDSDPLRTTTCP